MSGTVRREKQDLTYLRWSHMRNSSGTAGTFLKAESSLSGEKIYYKLSNFDPVRGVVGHECVNEIIVDRLLTILRVEHLPYELLHADILVEGKTYETYLCASKDFKERGESKVALDDYYRNNALQGESHYDFCVRNGWKDYIDTMIAIDYIIQNRDRHGANIEILRNSRAHTVRIAPLFDHGLSLLYSCATDEEALKFDVMADRKCQNFVGSFSCRDNLKLIDGRKELFPGKLRKKDKENLLAGLDGVLSETFLDAIWRMIYTRYISLESEVYENI
ncbi:MAG: hypothetical protein IJM57_07670 [Lachnospiraceae bacterium]|nr:hypothetical protein [Lachnospiraceae bacterium]